MHTKLRHAPAIALFLLFPAGATAQQEDAYDYWQFNREVISRGMQAVFLCNGLFTSNRIAGTGLRAGDRLHP